MENINSQKFENLLSNLINDIKAPLKVRNKIKNDILIRIRNNGDRLKYINQKVFNLDWTDSNRDFYVDILNQITKASHYYNSVLSTATKISSLSLTNTYTRREISILANNYNEQRGILVEKTESLNKNVFAIIDIAGKKTKYKDRIVGQYIYYYPLDTGRSLYPLNDAANVALKNVLGNTNVSICMFKKIKKDHYSFLGNYYTEGLEDDGSKNLIFVLKKMSGLRNNKEIANTVLSFWNEEDKWFKKNKTIDNEDKEIIVKARANQGFYRELMLMRFQNKCVLTDIQNSELLIASHIKPYSKCKNNEKIDPNNGLLLSALADKLFDRGLISFDDVGNLLFSPHINEFDLKKIKNHLNRTNLEFFYTQSDKYLKYHYQNIFKK